MSKKVELKDETANDTKPVLSADPLLCGVIIMEDIISNLRRDADHIKRMLGTTAPTNWLENNTQKMWDKRQKEISKQLYRAARILEATL